MKEKQATRGKSSKKLKKRKNPIKATKVIKEIEPTPSLQEAKATKKEIKGMYEKKKTKKATMQKNKQVTKTTIIKELIKGIVVFLCSIISVKGYYPVLPAYFTVCSMKGHASILVIGGAFAGMFSFLELNKIVKYVFILLVIGIGIRLYIWANRSCNCWIAGGIAGASVLAMNCAGTAVWTENEYELFLGLCEGLLVFGLSVCMHFVISFPVRVGYLFSAKKDKSKEEAMVIAGPQMERMESFAYAVNGLADAFLAMSQPKENLVTEEVSLLEQEVTGKLCASCDGCAICWNENRMRRSGGIRALLHAVVNHTTKAELMQQPYIEDCVRYEGMVEEAIQAFGRLELNHAWYNRLLENRYVIAQQLDAMASFMEDWAKTRINIDVKSKNLMANIVYETRESGLLIENLHIYEENRRICIEADIASKWDGGIPIRNYIKALEKATKRTIRIGKDTKNVLTQEFVPIVAYEDTKYYALQGIAAEKKQDSFVSGDSFSFFSMDDGNYHICLSDGMGSGNRASQESEMVVDLLQKFIEAGFHKEVAIKLMNSAMVLQGEDNSFSTLDYAMIDLYNGNLELIKIGGAATFIKRGEDVECIDKGTLPTGADVRLEIESIKKTLEHGDFLVMVTDGVIEYLRVKNPKETLCDIIAMVETDNAGVLAETILEEVKLRTQEYIADDMTILVTGIWEK
ncbi:MAG: SpoIIE family protein phosphatase [Lachnospiraceae bacterium]|nr:SpoIIE family protein phosphatase [Lachnospiraceae bacterium]